MNNIPYNFTPTIFAIEDMFVSGSGTSPYIIVSGSTVSRSIGLDNYYENRTQMGLGADTLVRPQVKVRIDDFVDADAWFQPNTKTMYEVNIGVDLAYHLDSKLLRQRRRDIQTQLANDSLIVQRALGHQQNLTSGSAGYTGIVSGKLKFLKCSNLRFDYNNSVAVATISFKTLIVLSNSLGI